LPQFLIKGDKMEPAEKEQNLYCDLLKLIDHHCMENEITFCQILGVLDAVKDDYMDEFKSKIIEIDEEETDDEKDNM
jgi:hypothetical protein